MKIESAGLAVSAQKPKENASDQVEIDRERQEDQVEDLAEAPAKDKVQSEEILDTIKALTENGEFSVRFEKDKDTTDLVVKIVDPETEELIRQVPAEEILELSARLDDLRGNIVNTVG